jgi:hypothetical protein
MKIKYTESWKIKIITKVVNLRIEGYRRLGDNKNLDVSKYYDIRYPGDNKVFNGCKILSFNEEEKNGLYLNNKRHCEELKPSLLLKVNEKITTKKNKQKEKLREKIEKLESEINCI